MPIPLVGLAGAAAGLYLHNRWRARGRRLSALVASGEHRAMLDRAAAGLGAEALETRLGAVDSLRALRRDFPVLRREVEELLSRHLGSAKAALAEERALPADDRAARLALQERPGDVMWPWQRARS